MAFSSYSIWAAYHASLSEGLCSTCEALSHEWQLSAGSFKEISAIKRRGCLAKILKWKIKKFEETSYFEGKSERKRKSVPPKSVKGMATAISFAQEGMTSDIQACRAQGLAGSLGMTMKYGA